MHRRAGLVLTQQLVVDIVNAAYLRQHFLHIGIILDVKLPRGMRAERLNGSVNILGRYRKDELAPGLTHSSRLRFILKYVIICIAAATTKNTTMTSAQARKNPSGNIVMTGSVR